MKKIIYLIGLYFFVIFLFAFIYVQMPEHFYHSYSVHDHEYKKRLNNLFGSGEVCRWLDNSFLAKMEVRGEDNKCIAIWRGQKLGIGEGGNHKIVSGPIIYKNKNNEIQLGGNVRIGAPEVKEGAIFFSVSADVMIAEQQSFYPDLQNGTRLKIIPKLTFKDEPVAIEIVNGKKGSGAYLINLFDQGLVERFDTYNNPELTPWTPGKGGNSLNAQIVNLIKYSEGVPDSESIYGRMLYFSFATITTIGYGDIVPLSLLARSLIMLEFILGTIVLGFLIHQITKNN